MGNILVYLETSQNGNLLQVGLELLTKARQLAEQIGCQVEALVVTACDQDWQKEIVPYGVDVVHVFSSEKLFPYTTLPHATIVKKLVQVVQPCVLLIGATANGRDLAPRVAAMLHTGLTANCVDLQWNKQTGLLEQIRPAFADNMMATIVTPKNTPQMAAVRTGVFVATVYDMHYHGVIKTYNVLEWVDDAHFVVSVLKTWQQKVKHHLDTAQIVVAGGYGVGSKQNFELLHQLAHELGAEVGATRAAIDAGWADTDCMIGQTGITVRPKLYIACGISGQVQHVTGMQESAVVVSINTDVNAPLHQLADYVVVGSVSEVLPLWIERLKHKTYE